jgi:hypothetical protein
MPTTSLQAALDWLDLNAMEGGEYTITVNANETIAPKTLSYNGKTVSVTLDGGSTERTIALSSSGSLFTVGSGVTLTLGDNITLQGRSDNTASLAYVNGGTLVMNTGSKISSNGRGGVYVDSGIFTMNSGIISGNSVFGTSYSGGGVYVASGTFAMSGGTISGNSSSSFSLGSSSRGGGVYVGNGTFIMSGGTISGNSSSIADSSTFSYGGGVYVASGTFAMSGGTVSGNTASATSSYGGGVYVSGGTFTMSGGTVSGNTTSASLSSSCGGGVYVASGTFTMSGGTVSGNTTSAASLSSSCGGGVYVASGTFTMSDGTISGNTASVTSSYSFYSSYGGGVYIKDGTFTKQSGGTIYGANASGSLKNAAINGQAVYVDGSPAKIRINTAGSGVTLDSAVSGAAGGWETPQSVQISLQTMSSDPSLSSYDTYLSVNQSGYFYVDTWNTSYASYTWYWNGEVIDGESASEYTMAAHSRTPGVYELSVVVTTDAGERLSARCRVVIKAN